MIKFRKMRRIIFCMIAALTLSMAFTACGKKNSAGTEGAESGSTPRRSPESGFLEIHVAGHHDADGRAVQKPARGMIP